MIAQTVAPGERHESSGAGLAVVLFRRRDIVT